jgi:hypothetical protein
MYLRANTHVLAYVGYTRSASDRISIHQSCHTLKKIAPMNIKIPETWLVNSDAERCSICNMKDISWEAYTMFSEKLDYFGRDSIIKRIIFLMKSWRDHVEASPWITENILFMMFNDQGLLVLKWQMQSIILWKIILIQMGPNFISPESVKNIKKK